ncbi:hypothetical protein PUNSTDRAFT_139244 [Punctularia strigosozonata HHB-11173 SS5]|uniref:Novel STAND NTPase 1 domain-containing protein n=1 Tax=Punctularia strigosozonata (strain HHB-11173) TaxID=741275 RepID=R7S016_PUNST|nr:uncharacterized protein PUNSTDRAFT_139244 [Punctularia strigosozonata HHB-11173 SS5]EIN03710.1 hypothetical protein PUNSTDRAFT_139244 [Punctularia strigosozonata HHB-11173 SS5]
MEHPDGPNWRRFDAALEHSKTVLSVLGAISDGLVMCEPLKGAVGLAKEVVAMIEKVRKNEKACTELARRIGALIFVILNQLGGKKEEEVPDHLRSYLGNLARTLTDIKHGLIPLKLHKGFSWASFGSALLRRESVAEQLSGYNSQIDHAVQEFTVAVLSNIAFDINRKCIAQTSTSAIPSIQISSVVSTPPIYFYGRDDVVEDAVGKLSDKERPHIALLGTGGIGKTSVALAILDHQAIKSRNRCCFVPCDSLLTASALVQAIVQVLGGSSSSGGDPMEKLASLLNVGSVVLALDNFESPWDSGGTQTELTEVLRMLAASPNVRLIVTMRGNSPPAKGDVRWSPISLDPLSPDDAMKLFCSVNREITENEKPDLDLLLDKCGGLPLAIKLLASVKGDLPCSSLLHRWERQSTDMLKAEHDSPTRLTSVDVSISLSLDSKRMKGVPEAIALLGVICSLPDGVQGGIDQLIKMNLGLKDVDTALATILAASLAFRASDGSVKVLSPIRQYMLKHHPPSALLYGQLLQHYIRLADEYGDLDPNDMGFTEACAVLLPEVGNTTYLFKQELRRAQAGTRGVARAAFKFTNFQYWTRPSTDLIDDLLSRWPDCGLKVGHREGLVRRARLRQHISDYSAAKADLEYALAESTAVEDQNMVAQCLKTLGDVHLMQGEYPQAIEKLTRAHDVSSEIGDRQGVANCLRSLSNIHRMQGEYPQAIEKLTRAHDVANIPRR